MIQRHLHPYSFGILSIEKQILEKEKFDQESQFSLRLKRKCVKFTAFNRRHHSRQCGIVVFGKCSILSVRVLCDVGAAGISAPSLPERDMIVHGQPTIEVGYYYYHNCSYFLDPRSALVASVVQRSPELVVVLTSSNRPIQFRRRKDSFSRFFFINTRARN